MAGVIQYWVFYQFKRDLHERKPFKIDQANPTFEPGIISISTFACSKYFSKMARNSLNETISPCLPILSHFYKMVMSVFITARASFFRIEVMTLSWEGSKRTILMVSWELHLIHVFHKELYRYQVKPYWSLIFFKKEKF